MLIILRKKTINYSTSFFIFLFSHYWFHVLHILNILDDLFPRCTQDKHTSLNVIVMYKLVNNKIISKGLSSCSIMLINMI